MNCYNKNIIAILLLCVAIFSACASVRTRTNTNKNKISVNPISKANSKNINNKNSKNVSTSPNKIQDRFADTTFIYLSDLKSGEAQSEHSKIEDKYWQSVNLFNNEDYTNACNGFREFVESYSEKDSIYYDSKFYLAECLVINNSLSDAENMLNLVLNSQNVPDEVMQKSIVRLGHIYCAESKLTLSQSMFRRLKNEYPDSKYLKVANCD